MGTAEEHMRKAFQALLQGDTAERDRQCKLAAEAIDREMECERTLRSIKAQDNLTKQ